MTAAEPGMTAAEPLSPHFLKIKINLSKQLHIKQGNPILKEPLI
jgi:hypothetical protein